MKIIIVLHHFLPEFVGGTEIYVFNLAKQLIQNNIEVIVVIPNLGKDETVEYQYEGIRVIKYTENSRENRTMILGKKKPVGLALFGEIIKKEAPSLVHFHELSTGRGISIFHVEKVYELKIPLIITFHVPFYTCLRGSLLYKGEVKCDGEIIIKRCTACMYQQKNITGVKASVLNKAAMALYHLNLNATDFNSKFGTALGFPFIVEKLKKDLLRLSFLSEKIVVIANWYREILRKNAVPAVKIEFIKQGLPNSEIATYNFKKTELPIRVVYIGRITPLKGLHLLIDSILELDPKTIRLDIYGDETEDPYVKDNKQKTLGQTNIIWKGRVDSACVGQALSEFHILCLPSAFEMSSLVIQEAFAAGIPVLASDVYGNVEQVNDNENGWLFQTNNQNDLKRKLEILINNPGVIDDARANITPVNTFKQVGAHHIELYNSIINNLNTN